MAKTGKGDGWPVPAEEVAGTSFLVMAAPFRPAIPVVGHEHDLFVVVTPEYGNGGPRLLDVSAVKGADTLKVDEVFVVGATDVGSCLLCVLRK